MYALCVMYLGLPSSVSTRFYGGICLSVKGHVEADVGEDPESRR